MTPPRGVEKRGSAFVYNLGFYQRATPSERRRIDEWHQTHIVSAEAYGYRIDDGIAQAARAMIRDSAAIIAAPLKPLQVAPRPRHDSHDLYRHWSVAGDLLYVGRSLNAVRRLSQHRRSPWYQEIATVTIDKFPSEEAVHEAEVRAIRTERPRYNKQFAAVGT